MAIAIIELCLSEGINQLVSPSVSQSVENLLNIYYQLGGKDLKTFLSLAIPNQYCLDVTK